MVKVSQALIFLCVFALCLSSAFYGIHTESGKYRVLDFAEYMRNLSIAFQLGIKISPIGLIEEITETLQEKGVAEMWLDSFPDIATMISLRIKGINLFWRHVNPANSLTEIEINTTPY